MCLRFYFAKTPCFTVAADFSGMTDGTGLSLAEVRHKAALSIDERGVDAAASSFVGGAGMGMPPDPPSFDVDRPFFVGIVDGPTNALLFAGHVVDPTR